MILSKLPEEVVINHVFPFLQLNDLLRLRRVCKFVKYLSDTYLRLYSSSSKTIYIIPEGPNANLLAFLTLKLPVTINKIFLHNRGSQTWSCKNVKQFFKTFGPKISHLCLSSLEIPLTSQEEVNCFETLTTLKSLDIGSVFIKTDFPKVSTCAYPSTFANLKFLCVSQYFGISNNNEPEPFMDFITHCSPHLQFFQHPFTDVSFENLPGGRFGWANAIVQRQVLHSPKKAKLRIYDLKEFTERSPYPSAQDFYNLVTLCFNHGVMIRNADANLIEGMMRLETWDQEFHGKKLASVIASLHYLHRASFSLELPHLEKILIGDEQGTAANCSMSLNENQRPAWSNLKDLEIWVDSANIMMNGDWPPVPTAKLLDFFFVRVKREKLETLEMHFYADYYHQDDIIPHPRIKDLCRSCPNLKILKLGNWPGSSRVMAKLWEKMPLLEEVTLENCKRLTDDAFIGKSLGSPNFLKLKCLKKLELDGLEKVPGITDALFYHVIRHTSLTQLHLRSAVPLKTITMNGILSLLSGVFATTIENFPLVGSIEFENVREKDLMLVETKFRSFNF